MDELLEEERGAMGKKTRKKCQFSAEEISLIVRAAVNDKLSHKDVASKYRLSPRLVQSLVSASKKDNMFLQQAQKREEKRRSKLKAVIDQSLKILSSKPGLFKA